MTQDSLGSLKFENTHSVLAVNIRQNLAIVLNYASLYLIAESLYLLVAVDIGE